MKRGAFDSEPPTKVKAPTESQQAADLLRDCRECSPEYRLMLLRMAERGSKLPKAKTKP